MTDLLERIAYVLARDAGALLAESASTLLPECAKTIATLRADLAVAREALEYYAHDGSLSPDVGLAARTALAKLNAKPPDDEEDP
jgi:hypothetical protein